MANTLSIFDKYIRQCIRIDLKAEDDKLKAFKKLKPYQDKCAHVIGHVICGNCGKNLIYPYKGK